MLALILLPTEHSTIHLGLPLRQLQHTVKPICQLTITTFSVSAVNRAVLRNGKALLSLRHSLSPRHTTLLRSYCQSTSSMGGVCLSHSPAGMGPPTLWFQHSRQSHNLISTGLSKNSQYAQHCTCIVVIYHCMH